MEKQTLQYEVLTKDRENKTYGIWNNDMVAWQFIRDWNGAETIDLEKANEVCKRLNNGTYFNASCNSFGGLGMGTF